MVEGPVQISRENGQRRIGIELNVAGRDIGGFVRDAQRRLKERVTLPGGYGTFRPVRADVIEDHVVDPEAFTVSGDAAAALSQMEAIRRLQPGLAGHLLSSAPLGETATFLADYYPY